MNTTTTDKAGWEMSHDAATLWRMARANPTPTTFDRNRFDLEVERIKLEAQKEGVESVLAKLREVKP